MPHGTIDPIPMPTASMRAIAASLSDKDMADLAAFYASEPTESASR
jgi:cytochrome c553